MAVGPVPFLPLAGVRAKNVVKDQQVLISQGLGGLGIVAHGAGVGANFSLGKNNA